MRRGAVAVGLSVLFVGGAAGCGAEGPEPGGFSLTPEPSVPSSTPSAAPSPTSTKDADGDYVLPGGGYDILANMPPVAKERSREGVMAFTKYYVHAASKLQMKPAVGQLAALEAPQCASCKYGEEVMSERVRVGSHLTGMRFETRGPGEPDADPAVAPRVKVLNLLETLPVRLVDAQGRVLDDLPADGRVMMVFTLSWQTSGWRVEETDSYNATPAPRS